MNEEQKNGTSFLKNVFTADKVIAALVVLMGGGNLFAIKETDQHREREIDRAIEEIHHLFTDLHSAMDRQKEILDLLKEFSKKP
jgi:hypothetical protein